MKQKTSANESNVPGLLHDAWAHDVRFRRFFDTRPDLFEIRFRWVGKFSYRVERHEAFPSWFVKAAVASSDPEALTLSKGSSCSLKNLQRKTRTALSWAVRKAHSGRARVDIYPLIVCPVCQQGLERQNQTLQCTKCRRVYPENDGIPILLPEIEE